MMPGDDEVAVAPELERPIAVVGEHLRHDEADLRTDGRLALAGVVLEEHPAIVGGDLEDALRMAVGALRGERARAGGHVDQRHLVAAERQARLVAAGRLGQRGYPHAAGDVDDAVDPGAKLDLDGRDVQRVPQRVR